MEDTHLLQNVLYYLLATVIAVPIFRRLGLGSILGYLTAGALIGPGAFHLVSNPEDALHFAEFGVVMLLFVIGLELAPDKLWRMRSQILLLGGGQLGLSALILFALFYLFTGTSNQVAIIIGLTLALSSTAFALQLMAERGIIATALGRKGFSILLLQDMAVIPILILVQIWAGSDSSEQTSFESAFRSIASVVGLLVASRFLLNPCLRLIAEHGSREVMTAAALLIVLGTAVFMENIGLSMGLGAFTAGIMLANSSFRHQLQSDIEPFEGLLLGLFFIAVGMTLDLNLLISQPLMIFGGALLLMLLKTLVISGLVRFSGQSWREGIQLGLMLSQGGEFAFVVLSQSLSLGFVEVALVNQVVLTVGVSMALTSPLVSLWNLTCDAKQKSDDTKDYDKTREDSEPEVIIAGFGRFGQIIGRILAASNIPFTALDKSSSHVDFVRSFGSNKIFYGDGARMDVLEAAGLAHAQILAVCVNSNDSVAIIETAQEMYPDLTIIARAVDRNHAYQLHALGVDHVFREYFAGGLEAARLTLNTLGYTEAQAIDKVEIFRTHDEKILMRAIEHKEDQKKLLELAKQGRKELEDLFAQDDILRDQN